MKIEIFERFYSFCERYTLQSQMLELNVKDKKRISGEDVNLKILPWSE
jgi:hypothetical protein